MTDTLHWDQHTFMTTLVLNVILVAFVSEVTNFNMVTVVTNITIVVSINQLLMVMWLP